MSHHTSFRPGTDNLFVNIDEQRLVAHGRHVRSVEILRLIRLARQWLASLAGRLTGRGHRSVNCH